MNELLDFLIDSLEDSRRKLEYIINYIREDDYIKIYMNHSLLTPVSLEATGELRVIIDRVLSYIETQKKTNLWEKTTTPSVPIPPPRALK